MLKRSTHNLICVTMISMYAPTVDHHEDVSGVSCMGETCPLNVSHDTLVVTAAK